MRSNLTICCNSIKTKAILLSLLSFFFVAGSIAQNDKHNVLLVQLKESKTKALRPTLHLKNNDVQSIEYFGAQKNLARITTQSQETLDTLYNELLANPEVEVVERPHAYRIHQIPNDPYYTTKSGINYKWHWQMLKTEAVWDTIQKLNLDLSQTKVAIIDNAIWSAHPDLQIADELQANVHTDFTNTGRGKADPPSEVSQNENCTPEDLENDRCAAYFWSHGTHVAGLVGAITNNGTGVAAMGAGLTLIAVRAGGADHLIWNDNALRGMEWAIQQGATVINMSYGYHDNSKIEQDFFNKYAEQGIIFVSSAGNDGSEKLDYPAAYENVISVASCNQSMELSDFSQYGDWIDIAAPGGYSLQNLPILSTVYSQPLLCRAYNVSFIQNNYDISSGTSMASPIVSGLCGILKTINPSLSVTKIKQCLQKTATPIQGSRTINGGIINPIAAIDMARGLPVVDRNALSIYPNPVGTAKEIHIDFGNDVSDMTVKMYDIMGQQVLSQTYKNNGETVRTLSVPNLKQGIYFIEVTIGQKHKTSKILIAGK